MHIMGHRPHHFPAPNVNDVVPYSPGLRRSRRYPGFRPHRVPYPARGCAVRARRRVRYQRAEWDGVHGCRRGVNHECVSIIHALHTHHMPPIRTIGTTPLGLFMSLAFTRGNAWDGATPGFMAQHLRCREGRTPDERGWGDLLEIPIRDSQRRCAAASHLRQNPLGLPGRIVRPLQSPTSLVGFTSAPEFLCQGRRGPVSGHARSNRKSRGGWPGIPAPL